MNGPERPDDPAEPRDTLGTLAASGSYNSRVVDPVRELELLRLCEALRPSLAATRDVGRLLRHALRAVAEFFAADRTVVAVLRPGQVEAQVLFGTPPGVAWDKALLAAFVRVERPPLPHDLLLAPLRRRGRAWGVLGLRRSSRDFERGDGYLLSRLAAIVNEAIAATDRERMLGVRDRIDRKIMEQIRPQDLLYQILDGLRTLTRYDHSSALLMRRDDTGPGDDSRVGGDGNDGNDGDDGSGGDDAMTLVAEQIAWTKGKSRRIGCRITLPADLALLAAAGEVHGFDRDGDTWRAWDGRSVEGLARLLDYNRGDRAGEREGSMLVAPLSGRDGLFGLIKVATRHPGTFGPDDATLLARFRLQAAVAIRNVHRVERLESGLLAAERKTAMAELARSVSHDINNALGSVLPLVQQMQADLREGRVEPDVLREDLEQVERSLAVCRRIFGGMLSFARIGSRGGGLGDVRWAVDDTLAILHDSFKRQGVAVAIDVAQALPPAALGQNDLEQLLLNLLTNAREAVPRGGSVRVTARRTDGALEIAIADDGHGIAPEHLGLVQEPFFTTKSGGSGLGLSICRTIVWSAGGRIAIDSTPGLGTTVTLVLPVAGEAP